MDLVPRRGGSRTTFTVWTNVFDRGRLQRGESILIHGGSSGIGTTAIQLAHALGARVFTTAGSAEKCKHASSSAPNAPSIILKADFVAVVRELTEGARRGRDPRHGRAASTCNANLESLAMEGRLVHIGQLGGPKAQINLIPIPAQSPHAQPARRCARARCRRKAVIADAVHKNVWPLLESGAVRVLVHQTFPLRGRCRSPSCDGGELPHRKASVLVI